MNFVKTLHGVAKRAEQIDGEPNAISGVRIAQGIIGKNTDASKNRYLSWRFLLCFLLKLKVR